MPTIKVSDENKARLDTRLANKIGKTGNPNITMDDLITELLEEVPA